MREYAKRGYNVIFIEAYLTWVKLFKNKNYWKYFLRIFKKPKKNSEGIIVATAPPLIPGGEWVRIINSLNWIVISLWIKHFVINRYGLKNIILFTFSPLSEKTINFFNKSISIYFCNDPFKQIFKYPSAHNNIEKIENLLTKKVDLVFCVSEKLVAERAVYNSNTFLVPLAVNDELFSKTYIENLKVADDIIEIKKPIIGHVGVLNNRIDIELVSVLADKYPDFSFVFIGPVIEVSSSFKEKLLKLGLKKNVYFLGNKDENLLPSYLKIIDVCTIPYVRDDVTKYIKANSKFFQYVSSGKPVVSTIGPNNLSEVLCIHADTEEAFCKGIERALTLNKEEHYRIRKEYIKNHTWSARVDEIEKRISDFLEKKVSK